MGRLEVDADPAQLHRGHTIEGGWPFPRKGRRVDKLGNTDISVGLRSSVGMTVTRKTFRKDRNVDTSLTCRSSKLLHEGRSQTDVGEEEDGQVNLLRKSITSLRQATSFRERTLSRRREVAEAELAAERNLVSLVRRQNACLSDVVDVKRGGTLSWARWSSYFVKFTDGGYMLLMDASAEAFDDGEVLAIASICGSIITSPRNGLIKIRRRGNKEMITLRLSSSQRSSIWLDKLRLLSAAKAVGLSDFEVLGAIGKGAHGHVFVARDRKTNRKLAMKVVSKEHVRSAEKHHEHAMNERIILELAREMPHFVELMYAFQTRHNLFLLTDFVEGGDLYEYQRKKGPWKDFRQLRIILAQVIAALEGLHARNVVYRDLKLENVMIHRDGHIRLADLGLSKLLEHKIGSLTNTVCGTNAFAAPEMFHETSYGVSVDLYALGVFFYVLLHAEMPFSLNAPRRLKHLRFGEHVGEDARHLCRGLLHPVPGLRLGCGPRGLTEIKSHPFFYGTKWSQLYEEPPFRGYVSNSNVYTNFDSEAVANVHFEEKDEDVSYSDAALWPLRRPSPVTIPDSFIPGYSFSSLANA